MRHHTCANAVTGVCTQDEWEMYKEIREHCSYNTTWFEVVGNHDTMMQFVCSFPLLLTVPNRPLLFVLTPC